MSRVYLAEESALGRRVVIKTLPSELARAVSSERFRREIRLAARLTHPHIVPLLTAGESEGVPWYTMPYLEGTTLRGRLAQGPMTIAEAVSLLRDVARALMAADNEPAEAAIRSISTLSSRVFAPSSRP